MMIAKRFLVAATLLLSSCAVAEASPIVFLVWHAEKIATGGDDPDLSTAGQERAKALARMLKDAEITAIFTTEFKRTRETAAPTEQATKISPTVVSANDIPAVVEKLRALKGNALVVGHGNTIPDLVNALGIETPISISMTILTPRDSENNPLNFDRSNPLWVKMNEARGRVSVEICYCSTLSECWTLHSGGGPTSRNTTAETRRCQNPSATSFQQ